MEHKSQTFVSLVPVGFNTVGVLAKGVVIKSIQFGVVPGGGSTKTISVVLKGFITQCSILNCSVQWSQKEGGTGYVW